MVNPPNKNTGSLVNHAMQEGAIPEGYSPVDITFFRFEKPGDKLEGRLIGKTSIQPTKGGKCGKYTVADGQNKKFTFLGSVQLDDIMFNIGLGSQIMIVFTHKETLENLNEMKFFKVYTKNAN